MAYCTPLDLIAHANRGQLIAQLSSSDFGRLPEPQAVIDYLTSGDAEPDDLPSLENLAARCQQVIDQSASDIDGYLALMTDVAKQLPVDFLASCNVDMAMFRLFEHLDEKHTIAVLNSRRHTYFNDILSGKTVINRDITPDNSAQTVADGMVFNAAQFEGY